MMMAKMLRTSFQLKHDRDEIYFIPGPDPSRRKRGENTILRMHLNNLMQQGRMIQGCVVRSYLGALVRPFHHLGVCWAGDAFWSVWQQSNSASGQALRISRKMAILIGRRILLYWFPSLLVTLIADTSLFSLSTAPGTRAACLCISTRFVQGAMIQQKK